MVSKHDCLKKVDPKALCIPTSSVKARRALLASIDLWIKESLFMVTELVIYFIREVVRFV
jgi:hypothetical protein